MKGFIETQSLFQQRLKYTLSTSEYGFQQIPVPHYSSSACSIRRKSNGQHTGLKPKGTKIDSHHPIKFTSLLFTRWRRLLIRYRTQWVPCWLESQSTSEDLCYNYNELTI